MIYKRFADPFMYRWAAEKTFTADQIQRAIPSVGQLSSELKLVNEAVWAQKQSDTPYNVTLLLYPLEGSFLLRKTQRGRNPRDTIAFKIKMRADLEGSEYYADLAQRLISKANQKVSTLRKSAPKKPPKAPKLEPPKPQAPVQTIEKKRHETRRDPKIDPRAKKINGVRVPTRQEIQGELEQVAEKVGGGRTYPVTFLLKPQKGEFVVQVSRRARPPARTLVINFKMRMNRDSNYYRKAAEAILKQVAKLTGAVSPETPGTTETPPRPEKKLEQVPQPKAQKPVSDPLPEAAPAASTVQTRVPPLSTLTRDLQTETKNAPGAGTKSVTFLMDPDSGDYAIAVSRRGRLPADAVAVKFRMKMDGDRDYYERFAKKIQQGVADQTGDPLPGAAVLEPAPSEPAYPDAAPEESSAPEPPDVRGFISGASDLLLEDVFDLTKKAKQVVEDVKDYFFEKGVVDRDDEYLKDLAERTLKHYLNVRELYEKHLPSDYALRAKAPNSTKTIAQVVTEDIPTWGEMSSYRDYVERMFSYASEGKQTAEESRYPDTAPSAPEAPALTESIIPTASQLAKDLKREADDASGPGERPVTVLMDPETGKYTVAVSRRGRLPQNQATVKVRMRMDGDLYYYERQAKKIQKALSEQTGQPIPATMTPPETAVRDKLFEETTYPDRMPEENALKRKPRPQSSGGASGRINPNSKPSVEDFLNRAPQTFMKDPLAMVDEARELLEKVNYYINQKGRQNLKPQDSTMLRVMSIAFAHYRNMTMLYNQYAPSDEVMQARVPFDNKETLLSFMMQRPQTLEKLDDYMARARFAITETMESVRRETAERKPNSLSELRKNLREKRERMESSYPDTSPGDEPAMTPRSTINGVLKNTIGKGGFGLDEVADELRARFSKPDLIDAFKAIRARETEVVREGDWARAAELKEIRQYLKALHRAITPDKPSEASEPVQMTGPGATFGREPETPPRGPSGAPVPGTDSYGAQVSIGDYVEKLSEEWSGDPVRIAAALQEYYDQTELSKNLLAKYVGSWNNPVAREAIIKALGMTDPKIISLARGLELGSISKSEGNLATITNGVRNGHTPQMLQALSEQLLKMTAEVLPRKRLGKRVTLFKKHAVISFDGFEAPDSFIVTIELVRKNKQKFLRLRRLHNVPTEKFTISLGRKEETFTVAPVNNGVLKDWANPSKPLKIQFRVTRDK